MAEEEAEASEDGGGGGKSGSKLIIIIVVVVLLLGLIGAGAFFALSGGGGDHGDDEGDDEELEEEEELGELPGAIFPLEVFIVNLGVKGSFLKAAIQLEFIDPEPPPSIENNVPKVRDAIIRVLSSKKANEILSIEGKEKLRGEVVNAVNDTLGGEDVLQVYFTEFIIQ
ncbi:MAG: flagellar basal body-associated FliL family protein [Bdellovibrionales bacterium]|nr:flagellar basal body-associated FliL family protein [Bdellovibrionales bacterium]